MQWANKAYVLEDRRRNTHIRECNRGIIYETYWYIAVYETGSVFQLGTERWEDFFSFLSRF